MSFRTQIPDRRKEIGIYGAGAALEKVHLYNPGKYTIIWTDLQIVPQDAIYG